MIFWITVYCSEQAKFALLIFYQRMFSPFFFLLQMKRFAIWKLSNTSKFIKFHEKTQWIVAWSVIAGIRTKKYEGIGEAVLTWLQMSHKKSNNFNLKKTFSFPFLPSCGSLRIIFWCQILSLIFTCFFSFWTKI